MSTLNFRPARVVVTTILLLVAGIGVHGIGWAWSAHATRAAVLAQIDAARRAGAEVTVGEMTQGGWPGRPWLGVRSVVVQTHGLTWRAETVRLTPAPSRDNYYNIAIDQQFWGDEPGRPIEMPGLTFESRPAAVVLSADSLRLVGRAASGPWQALINPTGMRLTARMVDTGGPFVLPGLELTAAWRDGPSGPMLAIEPLSLDAGPMHARGRFELRRPTAWEGDGRLHVSGYVGGLDDLAARGLLPAPSVAAAKAVLAILAAPSADGGADVTLRLRGDVVEVAGFPLLSLGTAPR